MKVLLISPDHLDPASEFFLKSKIFTAKTLIKIILIKQLTG